MMNTELCLKSIEAQLDRIERQLEAAQNTFKELEVLVFNNKLTRIRNEKTST